MNLPPGGANSFLLEQAPFQKESNQFGLNYVPFKCIYLLRRCDFKYFPQDMFYNVVMSLDNVNA